MLIKDLINVVRNGVAQPPLAQRITDHHIEGIAYLEEAYENKNKGAVLNHDIGMNFQIQVSEFLKGLCSSIVPKRPVLIVSSSESFAIWHYHLVHNGKFDVTTLSTDNYQEVLEGATHRVILTTFNNLKLLKEIKELFIVVVEDIDLVIHKNLIKQLMSSFNIGLTTRNFLQRMDQKVLWMILNWAHEKIFGTYDSFYCNNPIDNFHYIFSEWWQRLTWDMYGYHFKEPTDDEALQYRNAIREWARDYNFGTVKFKHRRRWREKFEYAVRLGFVVVIDDQDEPMSDEEGTEVQKRTRRQVRIKTQNKTEKQNKIKKKKAVEILSTIVKPSNDLEILFIDTHDCVGTENVGIPVKEEKDPFLNINDSEVTENAETISCAKVQMMSLEDLEVDGEIKLEYSIESTKTVNVSNEMMDISEEIKEYDHNLPIQDDDNSTSSIHDMSNKSTDSVDDGNDLLSSLYGDCNYERHTDDVSNTQRNEILSTLFG